MRDHVFRFAVACAAVPAVLDRHPGPRHRRLGLGLLDLEVPVGRWRESYLNPTPLPSERNRRPPAKEVSEPTFKDQGTEDIFDGLDTRAARRTCPTELRTVALRKLTVLNRATSLGDLRAPPGNRLEALAGDRVGQHSLRINQQYRICFVWTTDGPTDVEIVDYH